MGKLAGCTVVADAAEVWSGNVGYMGLVTSEGISAPLVSQVGTARGRGTYCPRSLKLARRVN